MLAAVMDSLKVSIAPLDDRLRLVHERALGAALAFRQAEAGLLDALICVEREKVFVKLGFSSMFTYAVQALGLSESVAYSAIAVARKACEVPALRVVISQGELSISKAKKIVPVITVENQEEWIEKAKVMPSRKLEKEVAGKNPRASTPERAMYVTAYRLSLSLGVSEELMLKFRRAQDQVSQARAKAASLEETLEVVLEFYLKHKDPVEKAKRVIAKKGIQNPSVPVKKVVTVTSSDGDNSSQPNEPETQRMPIPAPIEHQVHLRDQHLCQFPRPGGSICGARRWVDIHHIQEVSKGGRHEVHNLITLCKAHHREVHGNS